MGGVSETGAAGGRAGAEADLLIIGGGFVGLLLAAAADQAGLAALVVDRGRREAALSAGFDGRTSAIAAGSQRVLAALGIWDRLADKAEPILEIRVSDGRSPLFLHYDHRELGDTAGGAPFGHIVENRDLRRALHEHLDTCRLARRVDGTELRELRRGPAGVTAELDDGTAVSAALAVAADGRHSPIRRGAGIPVMRWSYPQTAIVCTVAHERPHRGIAHERFLPAGPFAILPMRGNQSSIVWTERATRAPGLLALDAAGFHAELARRFGDFLGAIEVVGPRWSYPLGLVNATRYVDERLALAGDAAHAIHPIAGQGLNLGIRDVAALAEVTVDAHRLGLDIGDAAVLERYQRWRRFDALTLIAATDGLNRLFSTELAPVRLARDLGLAAVNRLTPVKRFFMRHAMGLVGDLPRLERGEAL